jgi:excisionase family DNA binding protein
MKEIKSNEVYTTGEAQDFLRVSNSTIKRFLKKGILKANKVGGRYRIWGRELLRLVSPEAESGVYKIYKKVKDKTRETIEKW